jgi:DNA-directed RNA polymerase subunit K/omega
MVASIVSIPFLHGIHYLFVTISMPKKSKTVRIVEEEDDDEGEEVEPVEEDGIEDDEGEEDIEDDGIEEDVEEVEEVDEDLEEDDEPEVSEEKVEENEEDLEDMDDEEDLEEEEEEEEEDLEVEDLEEIVEDGDEDTEASSINSGARRTRDLFDSDGKEEAILELPGWTPAVFDRPLSRPYLTKYEYTHFIGMRAQQLARGAPPFVPAPRPNMDPIRLAQWELKQRCLPFVLKRYFPNGHVESFPLTECEWNESLFEW